MTTAHLSDNCGYCGKPVNRGVYGGVAEPHTFITTKRGQLMLVHQQCKDLEDIRRNAEGEQRGPHVGGVYKGAVSTQSPYDPPQQTSQRPQQRPQESYEPPNSTGDYAMPQGQNVSNFDVTPPQQQGPDVATPYDPNQGPKVQQSEPPAVDYGAVQRFTGEAKSAEEKEDEIVRHMIWLKSAAEGIFGRKVKVRQMSDSTYEVILQEEKSLTGLREV